MALTVQELIDELKYMDPEAYVHFSYNYGDHWRTQVAPVVCSVEEGFVVDSDYHRMPKVVDECDMYDDEDSEMSDNPDVRRVVLIG